MRESAVRFVTSYGGGWGSEKEVASGEWQVLRALAGSLRAASAARLTEACSLMLLASMVFAAPPEHARPYADDSPWNLKIGPNAEYERSGKELIRSLKGVFGCDPYRYTFPVYIVSTDTPPRKVSLTGRYFEVRDDSFVDPQRHPTVRIPIPDDAVSARGTDAHLVLWNPVTGDEWGFWKARRRPTGDWVAVNGYHYNTRWSGVPPLGFGSRGAGVPYQCGLVRPWELRRGRIDHALALGINDPAPTHVYPATKSDGSNLRLLSLPEGARLQLDPTLTERDFDRWGLSPPGKVVARALQEYGMIVVDGSGHPKVYMEYEVTAKWGGLIGADTLRAIPYSSFRLLSLVAPERPTRPAPPKATVAGGVVVLTWEKVAHATTYRVCRRAVGAPVFQVVAKDVPGTSWREKMTGAGAREYAIVAASHNGLSQSSETVRVEGR